jgi:hypothetical protein
MKLRTDTESAYRSFKDDWARLLALVSRDVRKIIIAALIIVGLSPAAANYSPNVLQMCRGIPGCAGLVR